MKSLVLTLLALACTVHAAGTIFSTVLGGSGQDYATAVTSDAQGNTYVVGLTYSPDFPVTPGAFQTTLGGLYYPDAFVAKISPTGKIVWATYLGGLIDDWATGVALDSSGNVWVTGWTRSANFPVVNPIQGVPDSGASDSFDAFVAELDPTGSKLLYSTYLGGPADDGAAGMALDSAGNVYVAVNSNNAGGFPGLSNAANQYGIVVTKLNSRGSLIYSYLHPSDIAAAIALDPTGAVYVAGTTAGVSTIVATSVGQALVFKISPDGSTKVYENAFGGSYSAGANAIAVDSAGEAWVAGITGSVDFPLVHPLQNTLGARPIWQSTNNGATWAPLDNLPFALPQMMVVDPTTPTTIYEATGDLGVFKSADGGSTWTQSSTGISGGNVQALAIDPVHTQTLYAATASTVYKSTDGAGTWSAIDTPSFAITRIEVDAQNPNNVYAVGQYVRKSTDGGNTWNTLSFPGVLATMVLDPLLSGHIIAASQATFCGFFCTGNANPQLYRSMDGGNTWIAIASIPPATLGLLVDPSTTPSTVYDGLQYVSADGGVTWTALPTPPFSVSNVNTFAVDPSGTLYAAVAQSTLYVSHNHGQSWTAIGSPTPSWTGEEGGPAVSSIVPTGAEGVVYSTINQAGTAGFVTKLSADGSTLEYSTYLRGHTTLEPFFDYAAEPGAMLLQNWISGIALDPAGNVIVTGGTRAVDFPTANPAQAAIAGESDAFAAILSSNGSVLNFATFFGGSQDDGALAAGIDATGNVILAGQTWSPDFPVPGEQQLPFSYGDAFVVKLATGPPAISSVLNGASYQPGIEAGSWVMITGINLANTTRTWTAADFTGDNLPTSLSGVSVTIDGKPAFPYYISPTQINVQAPSDSNTGAVQVVVDNNGVLSTPATAQLQNFAPAFFTNLGTSYAVATSLPNYAPVGTPSAPANPGTTIVLWGTGFGPTAPQALAGVEVSGAPATPALPVVTVGGMSVPVISSVLTTGTAGLYQITIQLPANVPSGTVTVQASIGGAQTPSGTRLFVGQ